MNKVLLNILKIIFILLLIGEVMNRYYITGKIDYLVIVLSVIIFVLDFLFDRVVNIANKLIDLRK